MPRHRSADVSRRSGEVVAAPARALAQTLYLRAQWGRLGLRNRSEEVDDFGSIPIYESASRPVLQLPLRTLLPRRDGGHRRTSRRGPLPPRREPLGHAPLRRHHAAHGRVSSSTPRSASCAGSRRTSSSLALLGSFMNRVGAVRACQENAERLLAQRARCVAVFPEGVQGHRQALQGALPAPALRARRLHSPRLRTRDADRALRHRRRRGDEPAALRIEYLLKALGLPYIPVTPTFPLLGPLGLVPAPTKWPIRFGEPVASTATGREAAEDDDARRARSRSACAAPSRACSTRGVGERKSASGSGDASPTAVSRRRQAARADEPRRRRAAAAHLGTRGVGHAGTLDPMATGVLVLLVGEATKLAPYLTPTTRRTRRDALRRRDRHARRRRAGRASGSANGGQPPTGRRACCSLPSANAAANAPAVSAIQIGGERAYRLVRRGETPVLEPRAVRVMSLELRALGSDWLELEVTASKGYYVRALARDLGERLGLPACLGALRRTESGGFSLAEAHAWPLAATAAPLSLTEAARRCLPTAELTADGARRAKLGNPSHRSTSRARRTRKSRRPGSNTASSSPSGRCAKTPTASYVALDREETRMPAPANALRALSRRARALRGARRAAPANLARRTPAPLRPAAKAHALLRG